MPDRVERSQLHRQTICAKANTRVHTLPDMTSDKVHEQSWLKWDSQNLGLIIEQLKAVLHEVYIVPQDRAGRSRRIGGLLADVPGKRKGSQE